MTQNVTLTVAARISDVKNKTYSWETAHYKHQASSTDAEGLVKLARKDADDFQAKFSGKHIEDLSVTSHFN